MESLVYSATIIQYIVVYNHSKIRMNTHICTYMAPALCMYIVMQFIQIFCSIYVHRYAIFPTLQFLFLIVIQMSIITT